VKIGLVTKTDSNPYFVKLRESAKAEAEAHGAELIAGIEAAARPAEEFPIGEVGARRFERSRR